jgi:putative transposase
VHLCEAFDVHRSRYKYWAKRLRKVDPKKTQAMALVKAIYSESNGSAGARTIATISSAPRLCFEPLSRYRHYEALRFGELPVTKTCV